MRSALSKLKTMSFLGKSLGLFAIILGTDDCLRKSGDCVASLNFA